MEIKTFIDVDKFTQDIDVGQNNLDEAIRQQTSLTAHYGIQHAAAEKQLNRIKLIEKTTRASMGKQTRADMVARGEKPSAASIEEEVNLLDPVKKLSLAVIDATEVERICKVAYDAFRTRRDMLVTSGNLRRAEMQTSLQIRSAQQEVEGYADRRAGRDNYRARREAAAAQSGE